MACEDGKGRVRITAVAFWAAKAAALKIPASTAIAIPGFVIVAE